MFTVTCVVFAKTMTDNIRILELFSGIGGMHSAFEYSGVHGEVAAAVDINTVANEVYKHNHSETIVLNNNIAKLKPEAIEKLNVNTILMSPPCQPFTRVGLKKDLSDFRSDALWNICNIIPKLKGVDFILMENVKGFETSKARTLFTNSLMQAGFHFREFILSPSQFGVPNTRHRYYCLGRKKEFSMNNVLWDHLPNNILQGKPQKAISNYLQSDEDVSSYILPDKLLKKRILLMDIVSPASTNSICFTRAYTHYSEGTGSIFTEANQDQINATFESVKELDVESKEYLQKMENLNLRYFTPQEVANLMHFPNSFKFPENTKDRQKYRLLGNSINVLVVGELMKVLFS